jgi:hypothetical protein
MSLAKRMDGGGRLPVGSTQATVLSLHGAHRLTFAPFVLLAVGACSADYLNELCNHSLLFSFFLLKINNSNI